MAVSSSTASEVLEDHAFPDHSAVERRGFCALRLAKSHTQVCLRLLSIWNSRGDEEEEQGTLVQHASWPGCKGDDLYYAMVMLTSSLLKARHVMESFHAHCQREWPDVWPEEEGHEANSPDLDNVGSLLLQGEGDVSQPAASDHDVGSVVEQSRGCGVTACECEIKRLRSIREALRADMERVQKEETEQEENLVTAEHRLLQSRRREGELKAALRSHWATPSMR